MRELKARYRGSLLGFLWTFLNPLLLMGVYALVFRFYMKMQVENYVVFLLSGLLPWIWFSSSLTQGVVSVVSNGSLITKVMFPPHVLPTMTVLSNLVNYVFSLPLLFIVLGIYGTKIGVSIVYLPVIVVIQLLFIYGLVMFLSSLEVHFRDLQHLVSHIILLWFFITPIVYPLTIIPERYRSLIMMNPMASLTLSFQKILCYNSRPTMEELSLPIAVSLVVMIAGCALFVTLRETFAEEL